MPSSALLIQAGRATLALLGFRLGPQDFPYSVALTPPIVGLTAVMAFLQYQFTLATPAALVHALASMAILALFTRSMLQLRGTVNRMQQTIHALFMTGSALTVLLLPPLAALAPSMVALSQDPESLRAQPMPAGPVFAVMILSLWNFLVSAHIYRHALDVRPVTGALAAFAAATVTIVLSSALTALVVPPG